ncbi:conserved hypothetical protein [Shewanella pealeana ATCC 700345]|uniref:DUF998 domain-containing protein n=2 Tax=Shewanella pealeana TaxID=70864 RepID=A8H702_SHEPA|nr:DUF998 domain-containing protein [Shewanella pealeana]ABV88339.1 conserved hypothetical protein [Shewanella pealeana ATCC 700345]
MLVKKYSKVSTLAFRFGMLGIFGQVLGLVLSLLMFERFDGESFNFFSNTLSELGSYGHSYYAVIVNGGLFFGGLCVVLFCLLSLQLHTSTWGYLFYASLGLSYFALAATGLFPINVYHLHVIAIKYFFIFSCSSLIFYGLYQLLAKQSHRSVLTLISAAAAFLLMTSFLLLPLLELGFTQGNSAFYNEMLAESTRAEIWWPAIIQWGSLSTFLFWTCLVIKNSQLDSSSGEKAN